MRLRFACLVLCATGCIGAPAFLGTGGGGDGGNGAGDTSSASTGSQSSALTGSGGGCDADLTSDPDHCGACGHACNGPCYESKCQPVLLIEGELFPRGIVVDDTYVYWVNNQGNEVRRMPKTVGPAETIATMQIGAWDLEISDGVLYWTNRPLTGLGQVMRMSANGGPITKLAEVEMPSDLVVGDEVYFVASVAGTVFAVDKEGGAAPTELATDLSYPAGITLGGSDLYITEEGTGDVQRVSIGGGTPTLFQDATDAPSFQIATTPTGAVWCGYGIGNIIYQGFQSGTATSVGDGTECWGVHTEGERIFWTLEYFETPGVGQVLSAESDGSGLVVHADEQTGPTGITTDAAAIYWTSYIGGMVFRVNK